MAKDLNKYADKSRWVRWILKKRISHFLPDKIYLSLLFKEKMGAAIDWENPTTFNEKLQWLKLFDRNPLYTTFADKYEVRGYISEKIGEEYLIPLIGVWDKFEEIDFDVLPDRFVLKCTHDSGGIAICKDKKALDIEAVRRRIDRSMKNNYFYHAREWPYKDIKPRIICEEYMVDESGFDLKDYKLMCFNGEPRCCFVCSNRNSGGGLNIDIFDKDWNLMPFGRPGHPNSTILIPRPETFDRMLQIAEVLSKGIPFIRVDFYEINGKLYFGELTFYPASGFGKFSPESFDNLLGEWIELPR